MRRRMLMALTTMGLLAAAAPAAQAAAARPTVTTGGAAGVSQTTARLTGTVTPNGAATTYVFQYGTTTAYGAATPSAGAGSGTRAVTVTADVGALAPATKYHYRLVASNRKGTTRGRDRTFTTRRQPLALSLFATPNPLPWPFGTTLAGNLSGTGNGGRVVQLQSNPFPYTQGFFNQGNAVVTDASGNYSVTLPSVPVNTQYRTVVPGTAVASPVVSVSVSVSVSTHVRRLAWLRRGALVRFSGRVRPAHDGSQYAIQRLEGSTWKTIDGSITHHGKGGTFSTYSKKVRIRRGGFFRVDVGIRDGDHASNPGKTVRVRSRRR